MNAKLVRLGWLILVPGLAVVLGILLLQGQGTVTTAQEPVTQAAAWPPAHRYLSTSTKQAKVRDMDANDYGLLVTWSEGDLSANGEYWMAWHNRSSWSRLRIDDQGGYIVASGAAALNGRTAHLVWVGNVPGSNHFQIFYRTRDLAAGTWSATEKVYPPAGLPDSADSLQDVQVAIDATGVPHVVWSRNELIRPRYRDRIYYSQRVAGAWSAPVKISGAGANDKHQYAQDMPVVVTRGGEVYVAWREKSAGETYGIYVRHRRAADGVWEPEGEPLGQRLSSGRYDEFPSMAAAGDRVYVMWDRWLRTECNAQGQNCYQVYSMTHRALIGPDVINDWWPADGSRDMLTGDNRPIVAYSSLVASSTDPLGAPLPDDYYSGVRPSIQVSRVGTAYRPCAVWHHWANEGFKSATVNDVAPYRVYYSCVETGDLESARWEDYQYQTIRVLGSDGIVADPLLALTPNAQGGYDLQVVLNGREEAADRTWGAAYANTRGYFVALFPMIFRSYD